MEMTVSELARRISADLVGDGAGTITDVGPVETSQHTHVTFLSNEQKASKLHDSKAGAVIVKAPINGLNIPQLVVRNVNAALIQALRLFAPQLKPAAPGIAPSAKIGKNVKIAKTAHIGDHAVIDDNVEIGDNTIIDSGCRIGQNSVIGDNTRLDANVVVYHNCRIGSNVVIQAGSTIGSVGFGYSFIDGAHRLIPHNGGVLIEDCVEIGANCCIDRAKFGNTVIGAGTKIDNLVQIAHNVVIGKCCLIAGMTGLSGSSRLGDGVVLAGQVGIGDHIEVGDGAIVAGRSMVSHNIAPGKVVFGIPAIDKTEAFRIAAMTRRLPKMNEQLGDLIKRLEKLENPKKHDGQPGSTPAPKP